jgi:hypothetical protein
MTGIAITAAESSGLGGLVEGTEFAKAKMDPKTNSLIKAVVADFETKS